MNIIKEVVTIPGTVLRKENMGNVSGMEFLDKIFYISDGIMLSQLKEISGLDGSTLQNWVKRGWVQNAKNKKYSKDTVARILIINMLKKSMSLEKIDFLLKYINGKIGDVNDDIIPESMLYDYICDIIDGLTACGDITPESLEALIAERTASYDERISGARRRLSKALEIIAVTFYSTLLMSYADELYSAL